MLSRFGDEPTQSSNTAGEPTDILDSSWRLNLLNRFDLVGIRFYSALRHKEPKKFAGWDAEHTLLLVELEVDLVQICKGFLQILHGRGLVLGFDHYIIHIGFHISM